jgi:glycosyltransferase involved in cell wall biosynthesis
MQEALQKLLTDGNHYARLRRNIAEYFSANHDIESIGPRYERLFQQLARAG